MQIGELYHDGKTCDSIVRNVISSYGRITPLSPLEWESIPIRALIAGACCSCGSGPPLVQYHIKGGACRGHRIQRSLCPQTLLGRPITIGVEVRGRPHCNASAVALLQRPTPLLPPLSSVMASSSSTQGTHQVIPRP
jgi:hypothetical protein